MADYLAQLLAVSLLLAADRAVTLLRSFPDLVAAIKKLPWNALECAPLATACEWVAEHSDVAGLGHAGTPVRY